MKKTNKEILYFSLPVLIDDNIEEVNCEMFSNKENSALSQLDCTLPTGKYFRLYETIIQDEISKKYIFVDKSDKKIYINDCNSYHKFIDFVGDLEIKPVQESSQLQFLLYSKSINFERDETLIFNLDYPKYSYIDCLIPASNSNNNECITCSLDTNKFPLTKEDRIILPSELKVESYSFPKWNRIKKEYTNISCAPNYTNIFYSSEEKISLQNVLIKGII